LRYQTTHDRTASRCLTELRKCRNERRRVERGFESQKLRGAQEIRKQERHEMSLRVAQAKLESKQRHKIASADPSVFARLYVTVTELAASIGGAA
jgi:hypothetical protein